MSSSPVRTINPSPSRRSETFFLVLLFLGFFFFGLRPIEDHDVWWHLATGRYIWAHHLLPRTDIFSWTCAGKPWIDTYWLYQIFLYTLYHIGQWTLIILYKGLMPVFIFWPVYKRLTHRSIPRSWILVGLWLTFWCSRLRQTGWGEHAILISLAGVSWLLWHLEHIREGTTPTRTLWIWPILFALWTNLHPGFLVGLALVGLSALGEITTENARRRFWIVWTLSCAVATLFTPYGIDAYRILWTGATHTSHISEWQRPSWSHMQGYWCLLGLFWVGMIRQKHALPRRWARGFLLIALFLSGMSLQHILSVPFFVIFVTPWVIDRWASLLSTDRLAVGMRVGVGALIFLFTVQSARGIDGGIDLTQFPLRACQFIDHAALPQKFYNDYSLGGFWIWYFGQRRPVFIDGRYPTVLGYDELWTNLSKAQKAPGDWQKFLKAWGVNGALLEHPEYSAPGSVYDTYFPAPHWQLVYRDTTAVIYVRRGPAFAKVSRARAR